MASLPSWGETPILTPLRLPESETKALPESAPAPCPLCHIEFPVEDEDQKQELLRHLLAEHKFVIAEVHLISSLPAYLSYWRRKFDCNSVEAFCTKMRATVAGEEQEFTFLSDVLPEDKELRRRLQEEKLEQVLAVQEFERQDTNFQRGCLFCRQDFNRAKDLFNHMAFDHNFSVGQPDNLVFVSRFLDMIEEKLEALLCLHCEKVFKSREVLKEHMRKKQHKQLNPRNKVWNQFYLVNYLEFGRSWEDAARDEEEVSGWDPGEQGDAEWAEWRGDHGDMVCLLHYTEKPSTLFLFLALSLYVQVCLYCPAAYPMTCDLLNHMKVVHGFDFVGHRTELNLNFYQQVRQILAMNWLMVDINHIFRLN